MEVLSELRGPAYASLAAFNEGVELEDSPPAPYWLVMDAANGGSQPYEPKLRQTYHSGNPYLQPALHVADIQVELPQFRSHGVPKQVRKDSPRNAQTSGSRDIS